MLTGWEDKKRRLKPPRLVRKMSMHEEVDANVQHVQILHEPHDIELEDDVHEEKEIWELHHDNWQLPLVGEQTRERHLSNQEIWHVNRVVKKMVKEEREKAKAVRGWKCLMKTPLILGRRN